MKKQAHCIPEDKIVLITHENNPARGGQGGSSRINFDSYKCDQSFHCENKECIVKNPNGKIVWE